MDLERLLDAIFAVSVLISAVSLLSYIVCGAALANEMKQHMPKLMEQLGNPRGVSSILMRNTSLYDDFLKPGAHENSESPKIRSLGEITIFAKKSFHYTSMICLICLLSLLALNGAGRIQISMTYWDT